MADFWEQVGQLVVKELVNAVAESALESMDPEQARVCRLLWRLRAAVARIGYTGTLVDSFLNDLVLFLNNDKADMEQGLQVMVKTVIVAKNIFEDYEEVQELIDDIKREWDRYQSRNMLKWDH